jgi:hypothetical protein
MAVTYTTGMRYTTTVGGTNSATTRIVRDVADKVALLDPNESPLVTLLHRLRKKPAKSPKYEWYEDAYSPIYVTAGEAGSSAETDIDIGTGEGDYVHKWDVLLDLETDELMLVTAEPTTDTVTITRGFGGSTVTAIGSGDKLFIVGNACDEGGSSITARSTVKDHKYNFTEIFKETIDVSRTSESTRMYGGNDRSYLRRKHGVKLMRLIERAFWFGGRDEDTTSGDSVVRATGGILNGTTGIATNITAETSATTEDDLETALEPMFRYGPKLKTVFCGPTSLAVIRKFTTGGGGGGRLNLLPKDETYGLSIRRYISAHGELNIIPHWLFYDMTDSNATAGTVGDPAGLFVVLDMEQLGYMYLDDTKLHANIQNNDVDGFKDQYISEVGVRMKQEKHHGFIKNVSLT